MLDPVTSSVLSVNAGAAKRSRPRREARLLDAAARLFARFGFDKTSIDEIARAAGVSKGAVYLHWPSKDALFEATLIREAFRLYEVICDRIDADPAGGTLAAIYRHSLVALGGNPLLVAVLTFDSGVLGDYVRREDPSIYAQRFVFGEEFVRRMQAAGLMRTDLEPGVTAYVMGVISFGLLSIHQLGANLPAPSLESLADGLADLVDRGLAAHTSNDDDTRSADAGKLAFRNLIDETKRLYAERLEAASGSHHSPRPQN
jgi:AcrR family transcriptional regulator